MSKKERRDWSNYNCLQFYMNKHHNTDLDNFNYTKTFLYSIKLHDEEGKYFGTLYKERRYYPKLNLSFKVFNLKDNKKGL